MDVNRLLDYIDELSSSTEGLEKIRGLVPAYENKSDMSLVVELFTGSGYIPPKDATKLVGMMIRDGEVKMLSEVGDFTLSLLPTPVSKIAKGGVVSTVLNFSKKCG